jgi:hypothetical protein
VGLGFVLASAYQTVEVAWATKDGLRGPQGTLDKNLTEIEKHLILFLILTVIMIVSTIREHSRPSRRIPMPLG